MLSFAISLSLQARYETIFQLQLMLILNDHFTLAKFPTYLVCLSIVSHYVQGQNFPGTEILFLTASVLSNL